ncbi:hypothetical protein EP7_004770 [Isosphaeraceae bacterium EP7]
MIDAIRPPRLIARGAVLLAPAAFLLTLSLAGCGQEPLHSEQGSPVVSVDSEAGKKALAESQQLYELRKEQEAKGARRKRALPVDPG